MEPLDSQLDRPLDSAHSPVSLSEHVTAHLRPRTVSTALHPYRSLSTNQDAIVSTITRFGQATSSMLRRLHYSYKTPRGAIVTCSDHLLKLSRQGYVHRIPYKLNGEYAYAPKESKARIPNLHTLDITALYTELREHFGETMQFDPEPWAPAKWRGQAITPDAYVKLPKAHYLIEVDRSSESASVIALKMRRYVKAYEAMDGGAFPKVIWLAHDTDRVRTLQREANRKLPELFECVLFDEALPLIGGEQ